MVDDVAAWGISAFQARRVAALTSSSATRSISSGGRSSTATGRPKETWLKMMSTTNPWTGLSPSAASMLGRRADRRHPQAWWWCVEPSGRYGMALYSVPPKELLIDLSSLKGLTVSIRRQSSGLNLLSPAATRKRHGMSRSIRSVWTSSKAPHGPTRQATP